MQAPTDQATLGLIASRYRPQKPIGSGSFGEIYGGGDTNGDKVRARHHTVLVVHGARVIIGSTLSMLLMGARVTLRSLPRGCADRDQV